MDKTLETVVTVHRLIIVLALALFVVGISAHGPSGLYDQAVNELKALEGGIKAASQIVSKGYDTIYSQSELQASVLAWLKVHEPERTSIQIKVISPSELATPDPELNPLVTLETQVTWADRAYRDPDFPPYFLCLADRPLVFRSLDTAFRGLPDPQAVYQLTVHLLPTSSSPESNRQFQCVIDVKYRVNIGTVEGVRTATLDIPSDLVDVTNVHLPDNRIVMLVVTNALRDHGLGDSDSVAAIATPALRELWTDLRALTPAAAKVFLDHKKIEEMEKAKEKIEILGESLDAALTIVLAVLVELFLMIYLVAHLAQIQRNLSGSEPIVLASPFFGIMCSRLGRAVMFATLLILPAGVCLYVLAFVLPRFHPDWVGARWLVAPLSRWTLVAAVSAVGIVLVQQVYRTTRSIRIGGVALTPLI